MEKAATSQGKTRTTQGPSHRAARRAAQRRKEAQRRLWFSLGIIGLVVLVVAGLVITRLNQKTKAPVRQPAPSALVASVQNVPSATLDAIGAGRVTTAPTRVQGAAPLTAGELPELVYVGAEYCPHCGAERWAMVNALSRFGTLTGLGITYSAVTDGDVPTFSFYGASYTSRYLAFSATETATSQPKGSSYAPLMPLTSLDKSLMGTYNPSGGIPFVDYGNLYTQSGVGFDDSLLLNAGLSWNQVASDLSNTSSPIARALDGEANVITATICKMTGSQPATVCNTPGVTAAAAMLSA